MGRIDRTSESKCEDQDFICSYDPSLQIRDKNDTLIYVISSDPDPSLASKGNFMRMLSSTHVVFDASFMKYNTSYYIFVLVGKKNGKGGIDFKTASIQSD